ncbi:MAG TPA: peptidase [Planctomycetaceae bacterium]|nr:peptidase [Planctomycetaceae bacterium]
MTGSEAKENKRKRTLYSLSAAWFRWLHIYISMLSFASLLFFAITGITLNHPTWFGGSEQVESDARGTMPSDILLAKEEDVDKLGIAEWFRAEFDLKGKVVEFEVDEYECMIVFKGPGYAADIFVDRELSTFMLTETRSSFVAVLNDLHKGRDSGTGWKWLIDISAVVMIAMALSGFGLLFYLKKRRVSGTIVAAIGTVLLVCIWYWFVP